MGSVMVSAFCLTYKFAISLLPLSGHSQCLIIRPLFGGSGILHRSYVLKNGQTHTLITNPNYGGAAGRLPMFALHLLY